MEENDVQLQLKKRARRRLVGAVAFVSFAAIVLPVIMDQEPRQAVQDVEIRIPGQDDKAFAPKFAAAPVEKPAASAPEARPTPDAKPSAPVQANARVVEVIRDPVPEKPAEKAEKPVAKPDKPLEKTSEKPADKPAEKPVEKAPKPDEAKRAAAILDGKPAAPVAAKSGEYLILIGAFSNEANVRNLREKLEQQGIKTFTEPLETAQGKKTRVRAGPFVNREAADKALEKMQKIGVSGVVSAKS